MKIIDIHTHVLPKIDDGASTLDMSLEMLHIAQKQGVSEFFATPHNSRSGRYDAASISSRCEEVEKLYKEEYGQSIIVHPGQEIFYRRDCMDKLRNGELNTMAGSSYCLVEFYPDVEYSEIFYAAREFASNGYRMILAHVERYQCLEDVSRCDDLINLGVYLQMNMKSIAGGRFDKYAKWCKNMLKTNRIHFIGTDMHNTDSRAPEYENAKKWLEKKLSESYLEKLFYKNAEKVISNTKI